MAEAMPTSSTMALSQQRTAAEKFFNITEVMENILLSLPCDTLLQVQRVNSTWRDDIRQSVRVQTALRLHAAYIGCNHSTSCDCNRDEIVAAAAAATITVKPLLIANTTIAHDYLAATKDSLVLNPRFRKLFKSTVGHDVEFFTYSPVSPIEHLSQEMASWTSMYLTHPPSTRISLPRTDATQVFKALARGLDLPLNWADITGPTPRLVKDIDVIENSSGVTITDFLGWISVRHPTILEIHVPDPTSHYSNPCLLDPPSRHLL